MPSPPIQTGSDPVAGLRRHVLAAAAELDADAEELNPTLERPPNPSMGDYSTNAALLLAPRLGQPPRELAARFAESLGPRLGEDVERVEVAGPGFVNLFVSDAWLRRSVATVIGSERFGVVAAGEGPVTLVEFVSANPTGPITVASGRHAAYGDSLCRILEATGSIVEREYYVNDAGGQVERFAASIAARMSGAEPPEDGYQGDYIRVLAEGLAAEGIEPSELAKLAERGVASMLDGIRESLLRFRVIFDRFSSELALRESGAVEAVIEALRGSGAVFESEGALWLRSSEFGDDKDRVLIRASGEPTYLAPDIAYHRDKLERGVGLMINVLGADHHGYVARMRAALNALGAPAEVFEVEMMQLVNLLEAGERSQMSKRRGEFTTLEQLLDDIGVDAARYFLLQRSHDTTLDLDLELARKRSNENPVYYVQYAHARIASLTRSALEGEARGGLSQAGIDIAVEPSERALIARVLELPAQLGRAAREREPHLLAAYSRELAADFHGFYRDCRVLGVEPDLEVARLAVCDATRQAIATSLDLLGIEAPESM